MKRVFILTFMITLILFFTVFGLCESYIAMQNTMSKDKITSVMEGFIDKEKGEIEIHFFGKELLKFHNSEISVPYEFSAFVPPYIRVLWIALDEISPTYVGMKTRNPWLISSSQKCFALCGVRPSFCFAKKKAKCACSPQGYARSRARGWFLSIRIHIVTRC